MGHMPKECLQSYLQSVVVYFRFGWEHGSSKHEVVSPFVLSSSPNLLVSRRLQRKMHKTCKRNSKKYEKIATFRASYSLFFRLFNISILFEPVICHEKRMKKEIDRMFDNEKVRIRLSSKVFLQAIKSYCKEKTCVRYQTWCSCVMI